MERTIFKWSLKSWRI